MDVSQIFAIERPHENLLKREIHGEIRLFRYAERLTRAEIS